MTPHDFACLHRRGYVVINRDGSTYNSEQMLAAVFMSIGELVLWFADKPSQAQAPLQLPLFEMDERKSA